MRKLYFSLAAAAVGLFAGAGAATAGIHLF